VQGATLIYLTMLFLTLFFAFYEDVEGRVPILVVCIVVQFFALSAYLPTADLLMK
jgi:hypothetical protein